MLRHIQLKRVCAELLSTTFSEAKVSMINWCDAILPYYVHDLHSGKHPSAINFKS